MSAIREQELNLVTTLGENDEIRVLNAYDNMRIKLSSFKNVLGMEGKLSVEEVSQVTLASAKSYTDNKVKTNVPAGAVFTDTITTINGKTGAISKADIVALGIQGDGSMVDLGTFNDQTELITHVLMNQLSSGHYTCIMGVAPIFMSLIRTEWVYIGTLQGASADIYYFRMGLDGEILDLETIDLRDLGGDTGTGESSWVNLGRFNHIQEVIVHIVMNQFSAGNYIFETPFGDNPSLGFATCIALLALRTGSIPYRLEGVLYTADGLIYTFSLNPNTGELYYVRMLFLDDLTTDITDQFS